MLGTKNNGQLDSFLDGCCTEIERRADLAEHAGGVLQAGATAFRAALQNAPVVERTTPLSTVPVLASLQRLSPSPLADAAVAAAHEMPWEAVPQLGDSGHSAGLGRIPQVRELGDFVCGLMLIDSGAAYPEHGHAPQEIYLPIAGSGRWRVGGSDEYRELDPNELVYNHPHDVHGVMAGEEPLLAMFILWP